MEGKYGMAVNRKSVGRNLTRLRDAGLPVFCREVPRMMNGKKVPLSLDWYWDHVLAREDLKALIDLLYFSHLPPQQVKQLAEKLKRIQIRSFDDGKTLVRNLPSAGKAADFDPVIALLTTAGEGKRKISFYYDHYEADGKRHHGRLPSGEDRLLSVSPLLIIASDDRYALLAEKDEGGIEVYFLDLMSDVKLLEDPASDTLTQAVPPVRAAGVKALPRFILYVASPAGPSRECGLFLLYIKNKDSSNVYLNIIVY